MKSVALLSLLLLLLFLCAVSPGSKGCNYASILHLLKLSILRAKRYQLGAVFVINDPFWRGGGSNLAHLPWTLLVFWVPKRNLRDIPFFLVFTSFKSCPSTRGPTAADSICSDADVVTRQIFTLRQIWYYFDFYIVRHPKELFLLNPLFYVFFSYVLCYCHFLFVFVCNAILVIGLLALDSAR